MEIFLLFILLVGISSGNVVEKNLYEPDDPSEFIRKSDRPYESDNYFEGDILISSDNEDASEEGEEGGGTGVRTKVLRWPKINGKVVVPYVIDWAPRYTNFHTKNILHAMNLIEYYTECIKFVKRTNQKDYISFTMRKSGCFSFIGKIGGKQIVNLDYTCATEYGVVIHELIHALGFFHMQSHPRRNDYMKINYKNIRSRDVGNFIALEESLGSDYDTPYDYYSIMHYGPYYFSKNGKATMVPRDKKYFDVIGQRNKMSSGDIIRLVRMYKCPEFWESSEESGEKIKATEYSYEDSEEYQDDEEDDDDENEDESEE